MGESIADTNPRHTWKQGGKPSVRGVVKASQTQRDHGGGRSGDEEGMEKCR